MKKHLVLPLLALLLASACTIPTEADFKSKDQPLSDDEVIVIWRFPRAATEYEVMDHSEAHAQQLASWMDPLFQQVIPKLFTDIKQEKLTLRVADDPANLNEAIIPDPQSRMNQLFGGSYQNLQPFMGVLHITQRRAQHAEGFPTQELELEIIAQDPEGKLPERRLGAVWVSDLVEKGYQIEREGKFYPLIEYLSAAIEYAYPIHYTTTKMAPGLTTLTQAFATKDLLLAGKWASLQWLNTEPNLSGIKYVARTEAELQSFAGTYTFAPDQGSSLTEGEAPITVEVAVREMEERHLHAAWSNQGPYHQYMIYAGAGDRYFTPHGDRISFSQQADGKLQMTILNHDGVTIVGYRN